MTDRWDRSYARAQAAYDAMEAPEDDDGRRPLNAADRRALAHLRAKAQRLTLAVGELYEDDIPF